MQELVDKICYKIGIPKSLIIKKPIRGLKGITFEQLIVSLLNTKSIKEAAEYLGYTLNPVKQAIKNSLGTVFTERTKSFSTGGGTASWGFTLLNYIQYKKCWNCNTILPHSDFTIDTSNSDSLESECRYCHNIRSKSQKSFIVQRTPKWTNIESISTVYRLCPLGFQVDHIIPLRGKLVSGLHVIENLQYLTIEENLRKSNKFDIN